MRRIPLVLLVLGLIVAIAVPFLWASALPVWLGAALLVVAGVLARRVAIAVAAIVAAVLLVFAPGVISSYRNGRGIAWTVPEGESLRLAQQGLAVMTVRSEPVLRGRDLRTGEQRWDLTLPERSGDSGNMRIWRAGEVLLTTGFDDRLRGVDVADGKVRWEAPPADTRFAGVTDGEHVGLTRCPAPGKCEIQSLSLDDGRVAWRAPVDGDGIFLGVPMPDDGAPNRDLPPWPASFVLVRDDNRWEARDLATGRVLARGNRRDGSTTIFGDVLVRSTDDGALTGTDVQTGARLWSHPAGDGRASISPVVSTDTLALPEGRLVLSGDGYPIDSVRLGERLRLSDPRTGTAREYSLDVGFDLVEVLASDRPSDQRPVVFAREFEDNGSTDTIVAGSHRFVRRQVRDVYVAPHLLGFESDGRTWGTSDDRVIEVIDRDSGERVVRSTGGGKAVYTRGEALVIAEGEGDDPTLRVIAR